MKYFPISRRLFPLLLLLFPQLHFAQNHEMGMGGGVGMGVALGAAAVGLVAAAIVGVLRVTGKARAVGGLLTGSLRSVVSATEMIDAHVYIEDDECACDFDISLESDDVRSLKLLLGVVASAAFEATETRFDFGAAVVERLDARGHAREVRFDADCDDLITP